MKTLEQRIADLRKRSRDNGTWIRQFGDEALSIIEELQHAADYGKSLVLSMQREVQELQEENKKLNNKLVIAINFINYFNEILSGKFKSDAEKTLKQLEVK